MLPRVLFVSKPIVPPWTDGSKCLVRDIACNLKAVSGVVMTTAAGPMDALPAQVEREVVYANKGGFAPALQDNARVLWHLLWSRKADLWHFVLAPNRRAGQAAHALRLMRKVPVVQTIASQPRAFTDLETLIFGDVVVAQSQWTKQALLAAWPKTKKPLDLQVIPPPVGAVKVPGAAAVAAVRERFRVPPGAPLFVYPGDLEVSQGARTVAALVPLIVQAIPNAVVVFACRAKTPHAAKVRAELEQQLASAPVRFAGEVPDFGALLAAARAVLFPVDDLYGKVDLPIALLEAMVLGVPVVALAQGPLLDLQGGAVLVAPGDLKAWVQACTQLEQDTGFREEITARGRKFVAAHHDAAAVAQAYERTYHRLLAPKA